MGETGVDSANDADIAVRPPVSPVVQPATAILKGRFEYAWLREVLIIAGCYFAYQFIRGLADLGARSRAYRHANRIVDLEKSMGIFVEQSIQQALLPIEWLITLSNTYYGGMHFGFTIGILAWLFFFRHEHYRRGRNVLAIMTLTAMVIFIVFPLAPPRLSTCNDGIPASGPEGPTIGKCFVDTLHVGGGPMSYQSPVAKAVANPYAAMPSLHFGWSAWCGLMLWWHAKRRIMGVLGVTHALITLFVIVVTGNHYILDAVGGAIVLGWGVVAAGWLERRRSASTSTAPVGDLVAA